MSEGRRTRADHPLLKGLWAMLPSEGDFPPERRAQWFKALAINLDLVYGDGRIESGSRRRERRMTDNDEAVDPVEFLRRALAISPEEAAQVREDATGSLRAFAAADVVHLRGADAR